MNKFATKYKAEKLGQHILADQKILEKIIEASDIKKGETILEIGPGTGILTSEILKKDAKVIAIEKDKDAIAYLSEKFNTKNIEIIEGDILKFNVEKSIKANYKIVANIPYYLTGRLLRNFLERKNKPKEIVLMVQKEVAQRIIAKAPHANLLSVSVRFYGIPEIIEYVPKKAFRPQPKVESAIIKISDIKNYYPNIDEKKFFQILRCGFSSPRKKLVNNLACLLNNNKEKAENIFKELGIASNIRPQELPMKTWRLLANNIDKPYIKC